MTKWIVVLAVVLAATQGCGGGGSNTSGTVLIDTSEPDTAQVSATQASAEANASAKAGASASVEERYVRKPLLRDGRTINLGIAEATPSSINMELYAGNQMPDFQLVGTLIGDFSLLSPNPVTVRVQDPDGFFTSQAAMAFSTLPPAPFASVLLFGKTLTTPGTFANKIGIGVCVDYGCRETFIGSPYFIPYSVRVLRGIQLPAEAITIRATFGGPPAAATMIVTPSEGAPASSMTVINDSYSPFVRGTMVDAGDGTARLTVTNNSVGAPAGTYSAVLWVLSSARSKSGFTPPSRMLTVSYVIEHDPTLLYLVTPTNALSALPVPAQTTPTQFRDTYFNVQAGATNQSLTYDGVELVSTPALEAAMPIEARAGLLRLVPNGAPPPVPPARTYILNQRAIWSSCSYDSGQTLHCLPVGRYPFKVHYTHRAANEVVTPFQLAGELIVGP